MINENNKSLSMSFDEMLDSLQYEFLYSEKFYDYFMYLLSSKSWIMTSFGEVV